MALVKDVYSLVVISRRGSAYTNLQDIADDVKAGYVYAELTKDDEEGVASAWLYTVRQLRVVDGLAQVSDVPNSWIETAASPPQDSAYVARLRRHSARGALFYWFAIARHGFDKLATNWAEEETRRLYRALYSVKEPQLLRDVETGVKEWKGSPNSVADEELDWMISRLPLLDLVEIKEITLKSTPTSYTYPLP